MPTTLESVIVQVRDSLNTIAGLPDFSLSPVHPEIHAQLVADGKLSWPAVYLSLASEAPIFEDSDLKKINPSGTSAELMALVYISASADHPILEIARKAQLVKNQVKSLTATAGLDFYCHCGEVQYDRKENGAWTAAGIPIICGAYDFYSS
ncbi:MAG: hypothetical protein ACRD1R_08075 [Acidobacteriota bacterium]